MSISKVNNKIVYTEAPNKRRNELSGTVVDTEFAIVDETNVLQQIKFLNVPQNTNPGVVTIEIDNSGDQTINLTQIAASNNAISQLTGDVTAGPGPGSVASTIANNAVTTAKIIDNAVTTAKVVDSVITNAKIANSTIDLTAKVTGLLPLANMASLPVGTYFYVDGSRSDSYTADGSVERPYKTIMAAVNKIIANGDNSASKLYGILIQGPYIYAENIVLEDTHLARIYIAGIGAQQAVKIIPASGNALQSTASNDNLKECFIHNLQFYAPVVLTGASNGTTFFDVNGQFSACRFESTITATNVVDLEIEGGSQTGAVALENITFFEIRRSAGLVSTLAVVTNNAHNQPDGFGGTTAIISSSVVTGAITVDAGSIFQARIGSRIGSSGGTLTINGAFTAYNSFIRSNITGTGTVTLNGSFYAGTFGAGLSLTNNNAAPQISYSPAVSGNWTVAPSQVKAALDNLVSSQIFPVAQTTVAKQTISSTAIDWSTGNVFTKTLGASTTFTFSNAISGQTMVAIITNTASNYTVTWPAAKWTGGSQPVQTIGAKTDVWTFIYDGTNYWASVVQNMS